MFYYCFFRGLEAACSYTLALLPDHSLQGFTVITFGLLISKSSDGPVVTDAFQTEDSM